MRELGLQGAGDSGRWLAEHLHALPVCFPGRGPPVGPRRQPRLSPGRRPEAGIARGFQAVTGTVIELICSGRFRTLPGDMQPQRITETHLDRREEEAVSLFHPPVPTGGVLPLLSVAATI